MIKTELRGTVFEIETGPGGCTYKVDGEEVGRDDYLAILQTLRATNEDSLQWAFDIEHDGSVAEHFSLISEALNPAVEDTFAAKLLLALERLER